MSQWPTPRAQSALVVLVPEAEVLVARFRAAHDPVAAAGVPAHITILFPFQPPAQAEDAAIDRLKTCFSSHAPFAFKLASIERFPGMLYLAPAPDDPFRALTLRVWEAFPQYPPYEGRHPDIIPHLTVAAGLDDWTLAHVAEDLAVVAAPLLPIPAMASEVALMNNSSGPWKVVMTFPLAGQ